MERNMRNKHFPSKVRSLVQSGSEMGGILNEENQGDGVGGDLNGENQGSVMSGNLNAENPGSGLDGDLGAKTHEDTEEIFSAHTPTELLTDREKGESGYHKGSNS